MTQPMDWSKIFSPYRLGEEPSGNSLRTEYERDYDRIIFSSSFRRLQNKTQVFPLPGHVLVHNRLTHSLEVASVGRSLGRAAGGYIAQHCVDKNDAATREFYTFSLASVIASACLAHDIGNPAFGHSGEKAISRFFEHNSSLRNLFSEGQWTDLTRFEGNANSFRIAAQRKPNRLQQGLGITVTTLAAMIKYPCESTAIDKDFVHRKKYNVFQSEKQLLAEVADRTGMKCEASRPLVYGRHPFVYLVEAADDICYAIMDWEDAAKLRIIPIDFAKELLLELISTDPDYNSRKITAILNGLENDPNEQLAYLRAKCINVLVKHCIAVFEHYVASDKFQIHPPSLVDNLPPAVKSALQKIVNHSVEYIYNHDSVVKIELAGYKILSGLLEDFVPAVLSSPPTGMDKKLLRLIPAQFKSHPDERPYEKVIKVLDFISGMTDLYALELYRNLRGISMPGHGLHN